MKYCIISLICGNYKRKITKFIEKEIRLVFTKVGMWEEGEMEEGGQKLQTSSYKINKY